MIWTGTVVLCAVDESVRDSEVVKLNDDRRVVGKLQP